ncbi:MAG: hypothetical protein ACPLPQ_06350 [Candidatus Saccharicenans sp.]
MGDNEFMAKYFRRRQFILGPRSVDYPHWQYLRLSNGYYLAAHPDLPVHSLTSRGHELILLGYWVDPYEPELNNQDILNRLENSSTSVKSIINFIEHLTGRFVLIFRNKEYFFLLHDACGLRNLVYGKDSSGKVWCASQPKLLAEQFSSELDGEMLDFLNLSVFQKGQLDFYFPYQKTIYKNIYCLLSNHLLDLNSGDTRRFWPDRNKIPENKIEDVIPQVARLLTGSLQAAARRLNLKIGLSAGLDSRITLAACKALTKHVTFFTHTPLNHNFFDEEIPKRLANRLKLNYDYCEIIPINPEFKNILSLNNALCVLRRGTIAFSFLQKFGPKATLVNSNLYEFSRMLFWIPDFLVSGKTLAIMSSLDHPLARSMFKKWLDEATPSLLLSKIHPTVLFELENISRWVAEAYLDFDFAHETFNPFNNRLLIRLVNSVNPGLRRGNFNHFDYKLIDYLWPEVLSEPINPAPTLIGKAKREMARLINKNISPHFPLLELIRFLKYCLIYKFY